MDAYPAGYFSLLLISSFNHEVSGHFNNLVPETKKGPIPETGKGLIETLIS